jgi:uncharacterized membrane protein YbhN (UPF0104 family)
MGALLTSVIIDRGLALTGLFLLTGVSLPYLTRLNQGDSIALAAGLVAGTALATAFAIAIALPAIEGSPLCKHVPRALRFISQQVAWALTSRTGIMQLLPLALSVHLLSVIAIFSVARALDVQISFGDALSIGPMILFAQVVPISIGGWGVREAASVLLLAFAGVSSASALAVSIMFGVLVLVVTSPGILCWLWLRDHEGSASDPSRRPRAR